MTDKQIRIAAMTDKQIKLLAEILAGSITPTDAASTIDANGGHVSCLTEAVMSVSVSLNKIALAIESMESISVTLNNAGQES